MKQRILLNLFLACAITSGIIFTAGCTKTEHTVGISTEKAGFYQQKESEKNSVAEGNSVADQYAVLPNGNFEGYAFHVVHWSDEQPLFPETESGDSLNDSALKRSRDVEALYNIVLSETVLPAEEIVAQWEKSLRAQTYFCDAAWLMSDEALSLALNGYLQDLSAIPYMSLGKEWWAGEAMKGLSMIGRQYFGISSVRIDDEYASGVAWYDRDLYAAAGLPDIQYQVKSGKWSHENMLAMTKTANASLNGGEQAAYMLFAGSMGTFITRNSADFPKEFFSAGFADMLTDKIAGFWRDGLFTEDKGLFGIGTMAEALALEGNYGLLPVPAISESQSRYFSGIDPTKIGLLIVPEKTAMLNRTGAVLEALAAYSLPTVEAEYRRLFGDMANDAMLDIILDNRTADLGLMCDFGGVPSSYSVNTAKGMTMAEQTAGEISETIARQIADMQSKLSALTKM